MRKLATPATIALTTGVLAIGVLYVISQVNNKDSSTTAARFLTNMCELATSNSIATLTTVGATIMATTYTFVTKPLSWMHSKCCKEEDKKDETTRPLLLNERPNLI